MHGRTVKSVITAIALGAVLGTGASHLPQGKALRIGTYTISLSAGGQKPTAVSVPSPSLSLTKIITKNERERRALALLEALGNTQPTPEIVAEVVAWSIAEDGSNGAIDRNNPWNTTICGHNFVGAINSDG